MKGMLDTCALLWFALQPDRLSASSQSFIASPENELFLSTCSFWEVVNLAAVGRLSMRVPVRPFLSTLVHGLGLQLVEIDREDVLAIAELPLHHRDPFDRMLVAQALRRELAVVTPDQAFRHYGVKCIW